MEKYLLELKMQAAVECVNYQSTISLRRWKMRFIKPPPPRPVEMLNNKFESISYMSICVME